MRRRQLTGLDLELLTTLVNHIAITIPCIYNRFTNAIVKMCLKRPTNNFIY